MNQRTTKLLRKLAVSHGGPMWKREHRTLKTVWNATPRSKRGVIRKGMTEEVKA